MKRPTLCQWDPTSQPWKRPTLSQWAPTSQPWKWPTLSQSGRGITLYRTIRFKEQIQCIGPSEFMGPREYANVIPNLEACITGNYWAYYTHRVALGDATDDAGTKLLPRKCRISTMPVSIGGSENPGNRICAIFLPPQYSCKLYVSGLERYITLKKQSKKTRMLQSMHSQLFVVLLYPPAGSGCCRISCRYSLVLRKMPGIDGAGSQYLPLQYLQYPLLNYKLHLKHECQYNTYLILVL